MQNRPSGAIFGLGCEASHDFVATNLPIGRFPATKSAFRYASLRKASLASVPLDPVPMHENKVITMRFRVSAEEQKQIEAKAKLAGLSLSEYVRRVATSQAVAERLPAELRQVITGVANNLNQLTRYAHLRQFDGKAIDEILSVLKTALR